MGGNGCLPARRLFSMIATILGLLGGILVVTALALSAKGRMCFELFIAANSLMLISFAMKGDLIFVIISALALWISVWSRSKNL